MEIINLWISYFAGLIAPLGAVCVIPLYPGFITYLASQVDADKQKNTITKLTWIITFGIILSMFTVGLIFSKILESSLTKAISIISPIAFIILGVISLFLIFNINIGARLPSAKFPLLKNPIITSLLFGLFFGAIVLPCNPAALIILFAISTTTTEFIFNLLNFTLFGIGMATPIILFAYMSERTESIIKYITINKRKINLITGLIMLVISLYYLIFVF